MEDEELPAQRYERDLVQKLKVLRHELSLQQPQAGHCRIEVSREEIFEVRDGVQPTVRRRLHSCSTKQVTRPEESAPPPHPSALGF